MAHTSQPLPYTASPYRLVLADLVLWARITFVWPPWAGIPSIVFPIYPFRSGTLDELFPTRSNLTSLILQLIFTVVQVLFLISIPTSAIVGLGFPFHPLPPPLGAYVPVWLTSILLFILFNQLASTLLNGPLSQRLFQSNPSLLDHSARTSHQHEKWVFVNGVAAGSHWMQSNLDRLSLTFRRPIFGIHNQTRGILFDLIECIMERTFDYATPSTRMVYKHLLDIVSDARYSKVVLLLHSQGAIEGGLALDWLFATVPAAQLARVEVYTFGSAANHFNNPIATTLGPDGKRVDVDAGTDDDGNQDLETQGRILKYIEHYTNAGDYVSKFGILNFRPIPGHSNAGHMYDPDTQQMVENRYAGRLFIRNGSGHQLNGNYLDDFFTMDRSLQSVLENNVFMDGVVDVTLLEEDDIVVSKALEMKYRRDKDGGDRSTVKGLSTKPVRAKDVSRLWMYRNGLSPTE